ncbi:uncharacterized protein BDR25DRAFT_295311 [Lindgomyces ingoldianus]|uniref:Uncharacterized protein n=1 Tax=Lindgomyces ingoldianus TaxID=673940 RepID=A0ACB6QHN0_9PLEO|nr:uncharacterized protein BDR25DRAFT_295311 [Lindgomyces ingoldianus]KAF2465651.1 hypothetical protein BDR25DRAFT_295311 [Lindgomyces ingoldianus]
MGNAPSSPKPGTEFQVIGAGLSRTGTASFSEALRVLLDAPVYHGGTQTLLGPEVEIRSMIKILERFPIRSEEDRKVVFPLLKQRFDGYAAATDAPTSGLVEELMELYPNAKVICTVRNADAWVKSIGGLSTTSTMWFLRVILFPVPSMRYFADFVQVLSKQFVYLYGESVPVSTKTYDRHIEWLKRVVPEDKLIFFDVTEGWEPLCKALGKPVPKDIPFPRINDSKTTERFAKEMIRKGLVRWAFMCGVAGLAIIALLRHL